jgi:PAS domain S-box-containing protein
VNAHCNDFPRTPNWQLVSLSILVLLVCLFYTYAAAYVAPYPGLDLGPNWTVGALEPCEDQPAWCKENQDALQPGDQLLAIGDLSYQESRRDRSRTIFGKYSRGDRVPVERRRGEEVQTVEWRMLGPTKASRTRRLVQSLLTWAPSWLAGSLMLLLLQPRDLCWRLLFSFNYTAAIWLAVGACSPLTVAYASPVQHAFAWIGAAMFLHLHLTIPSPLLRRYRHYLVPSLYTLAILLAIFELLQMLPYVASNLGLLVAFLGSLGTLIFRLFARPSSSDRIATSLMLAGIGLTLGPGIVLAVIPALLGAPLATGSALNLAAFAIPLLPLFYVYAIYKRHLGTLEFRANRLLSRYGFIAAYATVFIIVFSIASRWVDLSDNQLIFCLAVSTAFVIAALPLHARFQSLGDRLAYGTEHNPEHIIGVFANQILAALSLESLAQLLADKVTPSLLIRQSALYMLADEGLTLVYASGVNLDETLQTSQWIEQLLAKAGRYQSPPEKTQAGFDWVRLAIPLEMRKEMVGLWLFGRRDPDDYYPQRDIALLTTLAGQVAVALENGRSYEQAQREIIERKRTAEALRESEERYRSLFDRVPVGLYRTTPEGQILDVNPALVQMLGYPDRESLLAVNAVDGYVSPEDRRRWQDLMKREGVVRGYQMQWYRYDGTVIWLRDTARAIQDDEGRVLCYEGVVEDITERKQTEQRMLHTDRLRAMGHMAAALAHEINNPLQAIRGNLELLLTFHLEPDEHKNRLDITRQEIERLTKITRRVLEFARPADDTRYPVPIARLVQEGLQLVSKQLQLAHIQVTTDVPTDLPHVFVAPDQIVQAMLNLTINAIQAMPDGGHLQITARVDGGMVALSLTNDGPPIPPEHIERIFDPFFTTKPDGAGLGLSVSHSIIQRHGGTINVKNLQGERGVAFTITLPTANLAKEYRIVT